MYLFRAHILFVVSLFFVFQGQQLVAQSFDFSENCTQAYENIIALKIDSGAHYIALEKTTNPSNKIPYLLENYIDFLEIYTSNSIAVYDERKDNFSDRLAYVKSGDANSPYYLFAQAEIHLHSAVLHIKFGEYVKAVFDVKKALKQLKNNQEKYPDFLPTKKSLGMLYAILGSVPEQYQTGMKILGLSGDVNEGMAMLKDLLNKDFEFQHEAATVYAFLQLHIENDAASAWSTVLSYGFSPEESVMDAYTIGHIGIHGGHTDAGLTALLSRPSGVDYLSFPYLDFLVGLGKTYRQDVDANTYFSEFLTHNVGEDYVKSAYHKMAWNALIAGEETDYNLYLSAANDNGRAILDTDKQAEREYESGEAPNAILLKARLMSDGGYLDAAQALLEGKTINDFKHKHEKTEYYYRLGRIYDKKSLIQDAKNYYQLTIANGKNLQYYYAANAAYLMGYIYEQEYDFGLAKTFYEKSLSLEGYEYENSIHLKAKAGLNRIGY